MNKRAIKKENFKRRIAVVMTLFIVFLLVLIGYFVKSVYVNGKKWADSGANPRGGDYYKNVAVGTVYDRNGTVLAISSEPGMRDYTDDAILRYSVAQILGDNIGMTADGIEMLYKEELSGRKKNYFLKWKDVLTDGYVTGEDVFLTLDAEVQKTAYQSFAGRNGACVVYNYKTGEIVCSLSLPTYDIENLTYEQALSAPNGTFMNKAVKGQYTPGSIYKLVMSYALIENGADGLSCTCTGYDTITDTGAPISCYGNEAHGQMDLTGAFAHSCNIAYAEFADRFLQPKDLRRASEELMFNRDFNIRNMNIYSSYFVTPENDIEFAWASVGQYKTLITPLHAAMLAGAVANDGVVMTPHYVISAGRNTTEQKTYEKLFNDETAFRLSELMDACVTEGTGHGAAIEGYRVCGKTGTAEVDGQDLPNSWFIGYIDSDDAPYAIAVVIENAGTGAGMAVPAARTVLQKCITIR